MREERDLRYLRRTDEGFEAFPRATAIVALDLISGTRALFVSALGNLERVLI